MQQQHSSPSLCSTKAPNEIQCMHGHASPSLFQDGVDIKPSERIAALQVASTLEAQLRAELAAEGIDVDAAAAVEDDGVEGSEEVEETGWVDEKGEVRRPWCAATRILEHRENVSVGQIKWELERMF